MKRNNNFSISKTDNIFIKNNDNDNLDNITSLKELYDYFNSKEYKDKIKKEVSDILNGNIPQKNDNNKSNKCDSRTNEKEYKYENKYQSSGSNNNQNKIHLDLKSTDKKEDNYFNKENKNNGYYEYKSGNNNYRGWKGRGNWRGRGRGNYRRQGRGLYRGSWRGRGRGRGKNRSYNNYCYLYDNNDFSENKDESKNKSSAKENENKEMNENKNNHDCYRNLRNELNNSDSGIEDYNDDEYNDYYTLFSNDYLLNSLSDLNLNRLFNGLDLIGCDLYEDIGSLNLNTRSFRDEVLFNLRESNKGLSKKIVNNFPKIKIDINNKQSINPNKCVICNEIFKEGDEVIKVRCHHCFHSKCIMEWFEFSNYCPICRFILEEEKKD